MPGVTPPPLSSLGQQSVSFLHCVFVEACVSVCVHVRVRVRVRVSRHVCQLAHATLGRRRHRRHRRRQR